jgi:hypothetical protein
MSWKSKTSQSDTHVSYLDILLKLHADGKLRHNFMTNGISISSSSNLLYLCSNTLSILAYDLYISQLIRFVRIFSSIGLLFIQSSLLTNRLMLCVLLHCFRSLLFPSSICFFSSILISFENLHCSLHALAFLHRIHIVFLSPTVPCIWQWVKTYS